jgi:hypothetical protein
MLLVTIYTKCHKKKERITAARYTKGYRMLERYEGKLSRTVLRRGRASNRSFLFDDIYLWRNKDILEVQENLQQNRDTTGSLKFPIIL